MTGQETNTGWYDWEQAGGPSARVDTTFGHLSNRSLKMITHSDTCSPTPCISEPNYSGFVRRTLTSQTGAVHLRFYLYFSPGFRFVPGGSGAKLAYINSWIGSQSSWRTRFSYNKVNSTANTTLIQFDVSPSAPVLGPNQTPVIAMQSGRWYLVELMIQLNTPGQSNGIVRWWVDEVLQGDYTGQNVNQGSSNPANGITLDQYFGGIETFPRSEQYAWYDDVVVSTSYIGPSANPSPPSAPTGLKVN